MYIYICIYLYLLDETLFCLLPPPEIHTLLSSAAQGSPVKKKNVGRLRLSGDLVGSGGPAFELSPPRASINPFSPNLAGDGSSRGRSTMRDFSGDRLQVRSDCSISSLFGFAVFRLKIGAQKNRRYGYWGTLPRPISYFH